MDPTGDLYSLAQDITSPFAYFLAQGGDKVPGKGVSVLEPRNLSGGAHPARAAPLRRFNFDTVHPLLPFLLYYSQA